MKKQPGVERLRAARRSDLFLGFIRVGQKFIRPRESVGRIQQIASLKRVRMLPLVGNTVGPPKRDAGEEIYPGVSAHGLAKDRSRDIAGAEHRHGPGR